jgi:hypothetical protein
MFHILGVISGERELLLRLSFIKSLYDSSPCLAFETGDKGCRPQSGTGIWYLYQDWCKADCAKRKAEI